MALNLLTFYYKPDVGRMDYLSVWGVEVRQLKFHTKPNLCTTRRCTPVSADRLHNCVPDNDPYWHSLETQAWHECGSMIVTIVPLAGSFASELGGPN